MNPTASPGPRHEIKNPLSAGPTRPAAPKAQPLTTFAGGELVRRADDRREHRGLGRAGQA